MLQRVALCLFFLCCTVHEGLCFSTRLCLPLGRQGQIHSSGTLTALRLALPDSAENAHAGEKLCNAHFAACHAGGDNVVVADHTLEKTAVEKYLTGGFNEKAVVCHSSNGKTKIQLFSQRLSDAEVAAVAVYVVKKVKNGW